MQFTPNVSVNGISFSFFAADRTIGRRRRWRKKEPAKPLKQLRGRKEKSKFSHQPPATIQQSQSKIHNPPITSHHSPFTNLQPLELQLEKREKKKQMTSSPMAIECNLASNCSLLLPVITFFPSSSSSLSLSLSLSSSLVLSSLGPPSYSV